MLFVPFRVKLMALRFFVSQQLGTSAILELLADLRLLLAVLFVEGLARLGFHQRAHHRHGTRGVDHMNGFMPV